MMKNIWDHEDLLVFITRGILLFSAFVVFMGFFYTKIQDFSVAVDNFLGVTTTASLSDAFDVQEILSSGHPFLIKNSGELKGSPEAINAPSSISVEVKNNRSNVVFSQNSRKKLPIASLTKLMTALVVLEKYDLTQPVTIGESALAQEGEQGVLKVGEVFLVKDLLYITLIESSNRAAFALSEIMGSKTFIKEMNQTAKRIGLENTYFADSTGLSGSSYSTPEDLAILTRYLFEHYPLFEKIVSQKEYDIYLLDGIFHHRLMSTNKLLGEASDILGGKTGYTTIAKGCLMVIQKGKEDKSYFIHVILGADDRFLEMQKIINWVNNQ